MKSTFLQLKQNIFFKKNSSIFFLRSLTHTHTHIYIGLSKEFKLVYNKEKQRHNFCLFAPSMLQLHLCYTHKQYEIG